MLTVKPVVLAAAGEKLGVRPAPGVVPPVTDPLPL